MATSPDKLARISDSRIVVASARNLALILFFGLGARGSDAAKLSWRADQTKSEMHGSTFICGMFSERSSAGARSIAHNCEEDFNRHGPWHGRRTRDSFGAEFAENRCAGNHDRRRQCYF